MQRDLEDGTRGARKYKQLLPFGVACSKRDCWRIIAPIEGAYLYLPEYLQNSGSLMDGYSPGMFRLTLTKFHSSWQTRHPMIFFVQLFKAICTLE